MRRGTDGPAAGVVVLARAPAARLLLAALVLVLLGLVTAPAASADSGTGPVDPHSGHGAVQLPPGVTPVPIEDTESTAPWATALSHAWVRGGMAIGTYGGYAGLILLSAALVTADAHRRRGLPTTAALRWGRLGWAALVAATVVALQAQVPAASGTSMTQLTWDDVRIAWTSAAGLALCGRLALLGACTPGLFRLLRGERLGRLGGLLLPMFAVELFLTWPLAGQAGADQWWPVPIPVAALHVAATAAWGGVLLAVARGVRPSSDPAESAAVLPLWSRWSLLAVVALAGTGAVQVALFALVPPGPDAPDVGWHRQLLVLDALALAAILGLTLAARRWEASGPRLRRLLRLEIGLAAGVVGVATALVQPIALASASDADTPAAPAHTAGTSVNSLVRTPSMTVSMDVLPARTGDNTLLLTVIDPQGRQLKVSGWSASARLAGSSRPSIPVPLQAFSDGTATAAQRFPAAGTWRLTVTVDSTTRNRTTVTGSIPIGAG